jgi:hypothetical protein
MRQRARQTTKPDYVVNVVDEKEVTIDWFFGDRPLASKIPQLLLALVAWFFAVLPVVITWSAVSHKDDPDSGWWKYREGIVMYQVTMSILGILLVLFVLGFLVLYFLDERVKGWSSTRTTYDEERLAFRVSIAEQVYADKCGPKPHRQQQRSIVIEPYEDLETYELRDRYRDYGVGVE